MKRKKTSISRISPYLLPNTQFNSVYLSEKPLDSLEELKKCVEVGSKTTKYV